MQIVVVVYEFCIIQKVLDFFLIFLGFVKSCKITLLLKSY